LTDKKGKKIIYLSLTQIQYFRPVSQQFFSFVREAMPPEAQKYNRIFRARLTLELYKYPISNIYSNPQIIQTEIDQLLTELTSLYKKEHLEVQFPDKDESIILEQPDVRLLSQQQAKKIHACCHYLLSPRVGKFHLGLFSKQGSILGLASFSENDLVHLNKNLPKGVRQEDTLVLSRFMIFDNTPYNTSSYFLAQTSKWIRKNHPEVRLILSYLDPNLGFEGTIYKAYNARLIAEEEKKRYLYYHNRYATDRAMIEKFGTADIEKLLKMESGISMSKNKLEPLLVFAWDISRRPKRGFEI
jgi:hypothetical protein